MMKDFCTDCSDTIDSCTCDDFDTEIQSLKLENENLHHQINKMTEVKESILYSNQTLADHIKKQEQEIENLRYKNNVLAECALEDQKKWKNEIKLLKTANYKANLHNFIKELTNLTIKYNIAVYGCGCCDALYDMSDDYCFESKLKFNEETKTYEF